MVPARQEHAGFLEDGVAAERIDSYDISQNQKESILNNELDDLLVEGAEGDLKVPAKAWASALLEFGISNMVHLNIFDVYIYIYMYSYIYIYREMFIFLE